MFVYSFYSFRDNFCFISVLQSSFIGIKSSIGVYHDKPSTCNMAANVNVHTMKYVYLFQFCTCEQQWQLLLILKPLSQTG